MGVDILQALLAVDPDKRVAAFEEAVIDLSDASGSCSAASGQDALEIGHAGLFALAGASFPPRLRSVLLRRCFADSPVNIGGGRTLHVDVQRSFCRHMAQHPRYHPIVLLHCIPRQSGSFGKGRELRGLRVEAHIVPQLALFLCQLFWRSDARKPLLEIFAFLVHFRNQRLELFLALLAGMGVDIAGMLRPVWPYRRIASLKQVVIEFADAAGAWFPFLPHIGLEVHDALDRKSTRLNSSHITRSRMPSSA